MEVNEMQFGCEKWYRFILKQNNNNKKIYIRNKKIRRKGFLRRKKRFKKNTLTLAHTDIGK